MESLAKFLNNYNYHSIPFTGISRFNEPMANHTSFKTGGPVDLWIQPGLQCFPEYAAQLLESAQNEGIPVFVMGGGANLVVSDEGIRGIVLDTSGYTGTEGNGEQGMEKREGRGMAVADSSPVYSSGAAAVSSLSLSFRAGTPVDEAVELAADRGLSGLEFLAGMPGSIGGAAWMNARCYEREMSDVIQQVQVLDKGGIYTVSPKKEEFSYKKSPFQGTSSIILAVTVALQEGKSAEIRKKAAFYRKDREEKGHYRFPSAGSMFKNNRAFGKPTGQIIDELGLKGLAVGDAQVAPWHGNIIINRGKARSADILTLVETVEKRVKDALGLELEREVIFSGNFSSC